MFKRLRYIICDVKVLSSLLIFGGNSLVASEGLISILYYAGRLVNGGTPLVHAAHNVYCYVKDVDRLLKSENVLMDPSPKVAEWCQQHIANCTSEKVVIKVGNDATRFTGVYPPGIIILHPSDAALLEKALGLSEVLSRGECEYVQRMAFTLYHEIGHIKNHDESMLNKLTPLIAASTVQLFQLFGKKPSFPLTILGAIKFFVGQAALGSIKWWIVKAVLHFYNQYTEARADNFACGKIQDAQILKGAAATFKRETASALLKVLMPEYDKQGNLDYAKVLQNFNDLPLLVQKILIYGSGLVSDPNHPIAVSRAIKLGKRAEELERGNVL